MAKRRVLTGAGFIDVDEAPEEAVASPVHEVTFEGSQSATINVCTAHVATLPDGSTVALPAGTVLREGETPVRPLDPLAPSPHEDALRSLWYIAPFALRQRACEAAQRSRDLAAEELDPSGARDAAADPPQPGDRFLTASDHQRTGAVVVNGEADVAGVEISEHYTFRRKPVRYPSCIIVGVLDPDKPPPASGEER